MKQTIRSRLFYLILPVVALALDVAGVRAAEPRDLVVYYNRACADCLQYVDGTVLPLLRDAGYGEPVYKDYINDPANRTELLEVSEELGVPPSLQSHLTILVGERLILQGHVPEDVILDLLAAPDDAFERVIVYQDKMKGAVDYTAWAFEGEPQTYAIDAPIGEYLEYVAQHDGHAAPRGLVTETRPLLPLVLSTGLLDGLNPCAFAVLLFFIAFLFTIRRTAASIWAMGLVYVGAIYLAYFLIGLGLMRAVLFVDDHHFMARVGSWLVIGLGLINLKDYFFPQLPVHLTIPTIARGTIIDWLKRATLPTAAVGGFLVGLCTFPCSGGIYVAIVGLLASQTTYLQGVGYLGLYNLAFIVPLLVILIGVGNRRVMHRIRLAEQSTRRPVRLATGLAMVATGVVILVWFV